MMKIEFKTSGESFHDYEMEEFKKIFNTILEQIDSGWETRKIIDSNGNTIGYWSLD